MSAESSTTTINEMEDMLLEFLCNQIEDFNGKIANEHIRSLLTSIVNSVEVEKYDDHSYDKIYLC